MLAEITSSQGAVELSRGGGSFRPAAIGDALCVDDTVRVGAYSRAALVFANDSTLRLDQRTTLQLRAMAEPRTSFLELLRGVVHIFSRQPRALTVETAFVNAGTQGTEFLISADDERTRIIVFEGRIRAYNETGEVLLADGEAAVASAGAAPRAEVVVRPRDAVAWTLYYPPVLPVLTGDATATGQPRQLALASERARAQDYAGAMQALDEVPPDDRDVRHWVLRAGVLLNVGRADEAAAAIERALVLEPEAGEALAERAIIRIARRDEVAALEDARRAVAASPGSAAARIALSYALQANFELDEARDVLLAAAMDFPDDALVFARLAEVELALGYQDRALEAAERAAALAPDLGRTQMVLGFAALARIDTEDARAAFERAIRLDSANPLPRLGLGLAIIRDGDLETGRRQIEIAAGLDPGDGLIRSYLGKAYFEERRDPLAARQLQVAKELDPNDPTPWFYDAIRKQLENRPVEALRDLETAIDLNDNRAVYRSRLLLDQDLATRSVSVARIYDDLGFDQLAVTEASRSLSQDPANWSAHRFLSDAYARLPRHEIARVSELLQAQLLQPININPVQPSLAYSDLNVIAGVGPAEGAFNEFHPLFERNRVQLTATGVVGDADGNENTFGDEIVASALWDRFSASAGQFHYETDGFRPNNDLETDLYNLFGQWAVTPELNLQAEFRRRETDNGDLELAFFPEFFSAETRRVVDQDTVRLGARWSPGPGHDVLGSFIYSEREGKQFDTIDGFTLDEDSENKGWDSQAQYLFQADRVNLVLGGGIYQIDNEEMLSFEFMGIPLPPNIGGYTIDQRNIYAYGDFNWPSSLTWTAGLSFDSIDDQGLDTDKVNPKFGVEWQITDSVRLRAAVFESVKRTLIVDQTLEPTEVAGFNQFFDDVNGTEALRYGVGIDARLLDRLYGGLEVSRRELDIPVFDADTGVPEFFDAEEDLLRGYLYWAPLPEWAFTLDQRFETFERAGAGVDVETIITPLAAHYFHPSGLFATLGLTFLHQDVDLASPAVDDSDATTLLDASLGFRLPDRRGIVSLEGRNLLDEDFRFRDLNIQQVEPRVPRFVPTRTLLARLTLSF